jgi:16S rRNA (guanine(527)-N(7))-methyltransferase RsmG
MKLFHRQVSRETSYSFRGSLGQNSRMGVELPMISREEFAERLSRCGPEELSEDQVGLLHLHYSELRRWNRRVSLMGPIARDVVVERHYGESLEGLRFLKAKDGVLVDLGSGAGFPGFVLAVARPELRVTLVEAKERKWSFLESVRRKTGLSCDCLNARVDATPVEGLPLEIDWITARAVGFEDLGLSVLLPRLTPQGALLLWVGAQDPELPAALEVRREVPLAGARFKRILEIARKPGGEGR